jgi:hypothetical protein
MEVSSQLHAPDALGPEKYPPVPFVQKADRGFEKWLRTLLFWIISSYSYAFIERLRITTIALSPSRFRIS